MLDSCVCKRLEWFAEWLRVKRGKREVLGRGNGRSCEGEVRGREDWGESAETTGRSQGS
jgi:hypothetical protein